MTILPQLERDLFNAAEKRLRPDARAPHRRSSSPSSFRARLGRAAGIVPVIVSVAVAIAIAVVALMLVAHGRYAHQSTAATSPGAGSPRAELVQTLGVLRRPQMKGDLEGLQRLDRLLSASWQLRMSFKEWGYRQVDRRLVRVVNVPAWRAKVMIAPIRFPRSPTSGQGREGVQLVLWSTGATALSPTSLTPSGPQPTSVAAILAHGLSAGPVPPGLVGNVVHGPDVQDGVLLVPDGVASIKLGPFTPNDTPAGLSTKPLNTALATVNGTATVHDNIAAFQLAIPVYTGRWSRWPGPGRAPRFYYPGVPATAQATWFDARGHVIRRTTTQIGITMRAQVPRPATNQP